MVEICLEDSVPMSITRSGREQEPAADRFALSLQLRWPQPERILLWHQLPGDGGVIATPVPAHPGLSPLGTASPSSRNHAEGDGQLEIRLGSGNPAHPRHCVSVPWLPPP